MYPNALAVTTYDNIPKLRLLKRCGFRFLESTYGAAVLVLDLVRSKYSCGGTVVPE
jgi:hypothetical protein